MEGDFMSNLKKYVTVFEDGVAIGIVKFNTNLTTFPQFPDPELETKGLTKLTDGRYVLIYGTSEYDSEPNHAEIISEEQAFNEILESGKLKLFEKLGFDPSKYILEEVTF